MNYLIRHFVIFQSYVKVLEFFNRFLSSFLGMLRLGLSPPESEDWIWEIFCTGIPFTKRQYSRISRRVPSKMNWKSTLHNDCQLVRFLQMQILAENSKNPQPVNICQFAKQGVLENFPVWNLKP